MSRSLPPPLAILLLAAAPAQAYELGDCWQTKDPALEIAACTSLIASGGLNPDQLAKAHTGLGVGLARSGRLAEAIAAHDEAIRLAPGYPLPYVNRGSAYSAQGDFVRAIADFDRALALDADQVGALNNRAWARLKLGQPEAGLGDVERAIALKPKLAALYDTRGAIREALGQREAAIADFRAALALDPGLLTSRDGLARLGAAP